MTKKTIGFVLFEDYWQRKGIGSSRIRGQWLINYMPEAERFVQGKDYDAVIYQKAYWKEHARAFNGKKILDICDPDWLDGAEVVSFIKEVDAVTTSTEKLRDEIKKFTDKPVYWIDDREDLALLPAVKKHDGRAKKVAWFGYSSNASVLDATLQKIKSLNLTLVVISDGRYMTGDCSVENVKYDALTVDEELQKCDFCLLPEKIGGRWGFKSQNKTNHALLLGLPVAKNAIDLEKFALSSDARNEEIAKKRANLIVWCDVKKSVEEMRDVIAKIKK